jgi:uncharacterized protein (DUF305 family)
VQAASVLVACGLVLAGCRARSTPADVPTVAPQYDRQFLHWLVNYHHEGDRMIDPCSVNQTIRKELRDFCATVDQQHKERVERMTNWLQDWYSEELPSTDPYPLWLGTLKGQEFEKEFLKKYSAHHAETIKPMIECSQKATHAELRALCARVGPRQQQDVQELRKWRCDWFKECK